MAGLNQGVPEDFGIDFNLVAGDDPRRILNLLPFQDRKLWIQDTGPQRLGSDIYG
jgi:hypothetical protein